MSLREADQRAYCETGPGGGVDNSCAPGSKGSGSSEWKSKEYASWDRGDKLPIKDDDGIASLRIPDVKSFREAEEKTGIGLQDAVAIGGGNIRDGHTTVRANEFSPTGKVTVSVMAPVKRGGSEFTPEEAVSWTVEYEKKRDGTQVHYSALYAPEEISTGEDRAGNLRVASLLTEKFIESLSVAEKAGVTKATMSAVGDKADKQFNGYRLWASFGFDGPVDWRKLKVPPELVLKASGIDLPPDGPSRIPRSAVVAGMLLRVGGTIPLQKLIATREGERWWNDNGRDIQLEFDFKDKKSLGYQRFEKAKQRAARAKERNKSRDAYGWLTDAIESRCEADDPGSFDILWEIMGEGLESESFESRSTDCGKDELGRFAEKNKCQEEGQGGPSESEEKPRRSPGESRPPTGPPPTPFEAVSSNNPTKRSADGKKIESTSIKGAVITPALGGKEEIDPVSVGRHLLGLQSEHRGRDISTTKPLAGDDFEYMVSGIVSQVEAAKARGVGPNFYSPEDRAAQMEEYAKIQPLMRGGRTASGFCIGTEGPNGECEPGEGISPQAEFLFRAAQALTSPEANPFENMLRADKVLTAFFEEKAPQKAKLGLGVRMAGAGGGEAVKNFSRLQKIIDRLGLEETRRLFSQPPMRAGDFERYFLDKIPGTAGDRYKPNDYAVDELVPLFSIFGPKVGPFYANNTGDLDALTADIWFTRTWGRLSGELIEKTKPALAKTHASKLMSMTRHIPRDELSAIGLDGRQFRTIVSGMKKSGTIPQAVITWAEKREKQYRKDNFPSPDKGNGTKERYELDRLAIAVLKNQTRVLKVPSTTVMRSNMIRVMKEASSRTGVPIAYMQDILWQDEQDAWGSLGSRTTTNPGEPSLYSDVIRKIVENPSYRERRREKRSADSVGEPEEYEFPSDQKGGVEQALFADAIADMDDDDFAELAVSVLRHNAERTEESRNFAALDARSADCGRDDGGRFGADNKCQADSPSSGDVNKLARDAAREISGSIKSDDPRIQAGKRDFSLTSEPNSKFVSVPSDEEVANAIDSSKRPKFGANRQLNEGHPVDLRIDIPAFESKGVYAVTVHEQTGTKKVGSPIGYDSVVRLSGDVSFSSNEYVATQIVLGRNKTPLATVRGSFSKSREIPEDIDSWTPVGYDPKKAAFFYDKKTGDEVVGGRDAISVGNTVFVREPRRGKRNAKSDYRSLSESRDCGRTDDGRFGSNNKCQETGDGLLASEGKETWKADASGGKPFEGAERYGEISVTGGRSVGESLRSLGLELGDAIKAAGAQSNSYVWARPATEFSNYPDFEGSGTTPVFIGHAYDVAGISQGVESTSVLGERKTKDGQTERVLYHNVMDVLPEVQKSTTARHAAARAFYRSMIDSVSSAEKSGVAEVKFSAAGSSSEKGKASAFRGYTIWPRMGFDGPIPKDLQEKLPEGLSHAKSLLELHATREGTRWWAENGREVDVSMRLGDPSSPQRQVFERFAKRMKSDSRSIPLGEGATEEWLSPEDLMKLDEIWQEVWALGDLDDYEYVESRSADCGRTGDGKFDEGNKCQVGAKGVASLASSGASHDELVGAISEAIGTKRGFFSGAEKGDSRPSEVLVALGLKIGNEKELDRYHASSDQKTREAIARTIAETHAAAKADPSLKAAQFNIQTAESMAKKFGTSESRWQLIQGTYTPQDGSIDILAGTVSAAVTSERLYKSKIASTPSPGHTLVHEVAHREHFDSIADAIKLPRPVGQSREVRSAWAHQVRNEAYSRLGASLAKDPAWYGRLDSKIASIGFYATTDPLETYAEYATAVKLGYMSNDPDLDRMCKAMLAPVPRRAKT